MTPLERLAALKAAATLRQTRLGDIAADLGVSYNHFSLVIKGERIGSARLNAGIAAILGQPVEVVFPSSTEKAD